MGWWEQGSDIVIGDEPADIVGEMMEKLVDAYKQDLHRKPTVREIEANLMFVLGAHLDELADGVDGYEVSGVAIKLKKEPKRQRMTLGDVFAVPLPSGGYGFGRILRMCGGPYSAVLYVECLDVYSVSILPVSEVLEHEQLLKPLCDYYAIVERRWKVLGNVPDRPAIPIGRQEERSAA
jgi:hypothetical protein